jgi:hypothetical protein
MLRRAAVFMIALTVVAGCRRTGPTLPDTVQAKGKILLPSGQPLSGGRLEFKATEPPSIDAFADIQKDGTFVVESFTKEGGAVPGNYIVVVSPFDYHAKGGSPKPLPYADSIPGKYKDASSSDLKVAIESGKDNSLTLQLKR